MDIRRFKKEDAQTLPHVLHAAVHGVAARDYSQEQLKAWSPAPMTAKSYLNRVEEGRIVFVAVDEQDVPKGFIELEPDGHIDCFYCHPDITGKGIGSKLLQRLEDEARSLHLPRLYVEASTTAVPVFERHGFRIIQRKDFERHGVAIHNFDMEKDLAETEKPAQ